MAVNSKRANPLRHLTIPEKSWLIAVISMLFALHDLWVAPIVVSLKLSFQLVHMPFHAGMCFSMSQPDNYYTYKVSTQGYWGLEQAILKAPLVRFAPAPPYAPVGWQ